MRDTVFLRLAPDPGSGAQWLQPDETTGGATTAHGSLAEAARVCAGQRVVVLVPATAVLLTAAGIPTRNQQRILQALPYMLEDQLVSDVEQLHFALGRRDEHGNVHAAVVERDQMERWMEALREAGIETDTLIPEMLAIPLEPDTWTVLVDGDTALVRTGAQTGFAADAGNLGIVLRRALDEAGDRRPRRTVVYEVSGRIDDALSLPDIEKRPPETGLDTLAFLTRHLDEGSAINLLQGKYSRREQLSRMLRPWLPAAALLGALVLVNAGMTVTDYFRLSRASAELEQEIEQIYRETFPEAQRIVNPRVQMERRLQSLRSGGAGESHGFLELLGETAPLLGQTEGLQLQRINYRDGNLALAFVIGDLQGLDRLKQRLTEKASMEVEIQSASARNDGVEARLQLTRKTP